MNIAMFTISNVTDKGALVLENGRVTNCEKEPGGIKIIVEHKPEDLPEVRNELHNRYGVANVIYRA